MRQDARGGGGGMIVIRVLVLFFLNALKQMNGVVSDNHYTARKCLKIKESKQTTYGSGSEDALWHHLFPGED